MHDSSDSNAENRNADTPENRVDEIEQLRERLAFYESFDQLIHENITRAGDLLREAAARKSEGELAIRSATAAVEHRQLQERISYRRIFSGLLDEITTVQQNVERLARQVSDALDDLEAVIPAAGEPSGIESDQFPSMPTFNAGSAGELTAGESAAMSEPETTAPAEHAEASAAEGTSEAAETTPEPPMPESELEPDIETTSQTEPSGTEQEPTIEPVDELYPEDTGEPSESNPGTGPLGGGAFTEVVQASVERVSQTMGAPEMSESAEPGLTEAPGDVEVEPIIEQGVSVDLEEEQPSAETGTSEPEQVSEGAEDEAWEETAPAAATTVLVHGVPRATTALSLKRYLEGLAQVHSVEPREYAEGILRLQVSSDRPVDLDDLRGWPEGAQLEPVSVSDDFVEVRLNQ